MLADFFCGAGLVREALDGWRCVYALDNDPAKARIYEARFPDTKVHVGDVMNTDEVVARIPPGVVLAASGFPCTDVSAGGGKLGLQGPRSSAWYGFVAVLKALRNRRPPIVLIENVPALFTHREGRDFREVALALHGLGYRLACFVLHGQDFVPQSRSRVFIVGVADGPAVPKLDVPLWWERRARPDKLSLLMNDMDIPWLTVLPPPPPPRQDRLADIVDLEHGNWWPEERVQQKLAKARPATMFRLQRLRDSGGLHACTLSWKSKGYEMARAADVCHCLLPPRHGRGSELHLLVVVEDGELRMRHLTSTEFGLLMGSSGDWTRFRRKNAMVGLGDGVVVPAVRWINRHLLLPIASSIQAASEATATGRTHDKLANDEVAGQAIRPVQAGEDWRLIQGDCRQVLRQVKPRSVRCCVTSPPYWSMRDYGAGEGEIGREPTLDGYVSGMVAVFRLVRQALTDDGTLWLVLGDAYVGSCGRSVLRDGSAHLAEVPPCGLPRKNIIGLPWRVALALQEDGWLLRSEMIWQKPNARPESVRDRPTRSHEHIFLLAKRQRYFSNMDTLREPLAEATIQRRKYPQGPRMATHGRPGGRNARTVWNIPVTRPVGSHTAPFPERLAERCILAGCEAGNTVLDPFAGSASTGEAALRLGRRFLGIELSERYCEEARLRLEQTAGLGRTA